MISLDETDALIREIHESRRLQDDEYPAHAPKTCRSCLKKGVQPDLTRVVPKFVVDGLDSGRFGFEIGKERPIPKVCCLEDRVESLRGTSPIVWSAKEVDGVKPLAQCLVSGVVLREEEGLFRVNGPLFLVFCQQ